MKLNRALEQLRPPNLILSDQILNEEGCSIVAKFLSTNPQFINIELRGCNINSKGFENICKALPLETRTLLAEWNSVGNGVAALCDVLLNPNCQIQLIDLKNNRIQPDICARFAQVLKQNQCLQSLNLKWNEIGEKGAHYLWEGLHYNKTLKFLDISCNKVPEGIATQIRDKVDQNRSSDLMNKNQQNIKDAQRQSVVNNSNSQVNAQTVKTMKKETPPIAQKKNDTIRAAQLKEQIDQELRSNRLINEELTNRMNQLRQDLLGKEQAVAMAKRRHEELLSSKAIIEAEYNSIRIKFDDLSSDSDQRQADTMDDYIQKNKHILALENEYMHELQSIRHDNKAQVDQVNSQWLPRLDGIEHKYNSLLKANDRYNQELLRMKELFLKMRLDHDENVKSLEGRVLIEEKGKYQHQLDVTRKKEIEVKQDLQRSQQKGIQIQDDVMRQESNFARDRDEIEQQIQLERENVHTNHLTISKRSIKIEKLINNNIVLDSHIEKLIRKVDETYFTINNIRDTMVDDSQKRRNQHEQEYIIHKQNQQLTHQRILELELLLRNQEGNNTKIRSEYEKLCHIIQGRVQNTVAEVCRVNLQLN